MEGFKSLNRKVYHGKLVFVRTVRNIIWDENQETEVFEYSDKMKAGFILEISKHFDDYYPIFPCRTMSRNIIDGDCKDWISVI